MKCCDIITLPRGGDIGSPGLPGEAGIQGIQGLQGIQGQGGLIPQGQVRKLVKEYFAGNAISFTINIPLVALVSAGFTGAYIPKLKIFYSDVNRIVWRDMKLALPQLINSITRSGFGDINIGITSFSNGDYFRVIVYG